MYAIDIKKQLKLLGKSLPQPPQAVGNYQTFTCSENIVFISGQLPLVASKLAYKGKVGGDLCIEDGIKAAELCALNILSHIFELQKQREFKKLIKIEGFINTNSTFTQHARVLNGASDLLSSVLRDKAGHARSVVGCSSLPLNAPIEIVATIEVS